jgi:hypothetical protein
MEIERDVDWRSRAACGPDNAEWFWLVSGCGPTKFSADNRAALALCGGCPVRQQCFDAEASSRVRDPHIAAGLLWNADGPRVVREVRRRADR